MQEEMCEEYPIMQTVMTEMWELLTEEEKKKVTIMRMDMIIKWTEAKISDMEEMTQLKREFIAYMQKVQEILKLDICFP